MSLSTTQSIRTAVTETIVRETFKSLKGSHQKDGVRSMCRRESHPGSVPAVRGGCLADDMGLGKTYEVCALLRLRPMPTLVVVTLSTLMQWQGVLGSHGRGLPFVLRSRAQAAALGVGGFGQTNTILTTYSMFQRGIDGVPTCLRGPWGRIVLDEAHIIRNQKSNVHCALGRVAEHSVHRWLLTGTPVNNSICDLDSLLSWLGAPGLSVDMAKKHLILRRTLKDEAVRSKDFELPGVSVHDCLVEMDSRERVMYDLVEASGRAYATQECVSVIDALPPSSLESDMDLDPTGHQDMRAGVCVSHHRAMVAILRCRQACTHISLLSDAIALATSKSDSPLKSVITHPIVVQEACRYPADVTFSSKMRRLVELIGSHPTEKSLVFCDWMKEMDLVQQALTTSGVVSDIVRYNGSMDLRERECALRSFATLESGAVLIAQIQCGGTGLNIQSASRVYLMRPAWNPCVEQQAIGRAHRLGQTRHVTVVRLISASTIDVRCLQIQARKLNVINSVLGQDDGVNARESGCGRLDTSDTLVLLKGESVKRSRVQDPLEHS